MSIVLDDIDDQMFLSSQIYEEAKHTAFFDRYWRNVVNPAAERLGLEATPPTGARFFNDSYTHIFDETERAMGELLEDDSPEQMARAIAHYHIVVESVMARRATTPSRRSTASRTATSPTGRCPTCPACWRASATSGATRAATSAGVSAGFREFVQNDVVDPQVVRGTLQDLMVHVAKNNSDYSVISDPGAMISYSRDKLTRRIEIITQQDAEIPDVEELVALENEPDAAAD